MSDELTQVQENSETQQNDDLQNIGPELPADLQNEPEQTEQASDEDAPKVQNAAPDYQATNQELDMLLAGLGGADDDDAPSDDINPAKTDLIDKDAAAGFAVQGVIQAVKFASEQTGKPLKINQMQLMIISTLMTPAIMKHGNAVMQYIESMGEGIDDDSYIPEYMALGGAGTLAGSLWWSHRKAVKNGD